MTMLSLFRGGLAEGRALGKYIVQNFMGSRDHDHHHHDHDGDSGAITFWVNVGNNASSLYPSLNQQGQEGDLIWQTPLAPGDTLPPGY